MPEGHLQLDEDQRQAIDEPDQIGTAFVDGAGDPELGDQEEVIVLGHVPVNDPDRLVGVVAVVVLVRDLHAFLEELVGLTVGLGRAHGRTISDQFFNRRDEGFARDAGIQLL